MFKFRVGLPGFQRKTCAEMPGAFVLRCKMFVSCFRLDRVSSLRALWTMHNCVCVFGIFSVQASNDIVENLMSALASVGFCVCVHFSFRHVAHLLFTKHKFTHYAWRKDRMMSIIRIHSHVVCEFICWAAGGLRWFINLRPTQSYMLAKCALESEFEFVAKLITTTVVLGDNDHATYSDGC